MTIQPIVTTVCSNMHCYNRAELTNDPSKPPFCSKCKALKAKTAVTIQEESNE